MKTTIDIADPVFNRLRALAVRERTTLRALVDRALRRFLASPRDGAAGTTFVVRDASVGGHGLDPSLRDGSWSEIRERVYDGRGGTGS